MRTGLARPFQRYLSMPEFQDFPKDGLLNGQWSSIFSTFYSSKNRLGCFFTGFPAIRYYGISLILSLKEKSLSLGRKSLSLEKNTGVYGENPPV